MVKISPCPRSHPIIGSRFLDRNQATHPVSPAMVGRHSRRVDRVHHDVVKVAISKATRHSADTLAPSKVGIAGSTMFRLKSSSSMIGLLGFVLLLAYIYSSESSHSLRSDKASYFRGRAEIPVGPSVGSTIDLSQMIPTTKRVAGMSGHASCSDTARSSSD